VDKADGARADAATISSTFLFSCECHLWVTDVLRGGAERRGMVHGYGCMVRGRCDEPRDVEQLGAACDVSVFGKVPRGAVRLGPSALRCLSSREVPETRHRSYSLYAG